MSSGSELCDDISDRENISNFVSTLTLELKKLEVNLQTYLTNVETKEQQQNSRLGEDIDILKSELNTLEEGVRFILGPFLQNIHGEMYDLNRVVQKQEVELCRYEAQCENQDEIIRGHEEKVKKLELRISEQNSFLSNLDNQDEIVRNLEEKVKKFEEKIREQNLFVSNLKKQNADIVRNLEEKIEKLEVTIREQNSFVSNLKREDTEIVRNYEEKVKKLEVTIREQDSFVSNLRKQDAEIVRNLEEKVKKLEVTVREQDVFLLKLGSTFASLLWKASKGREATKTIIESSKLTDLFNIIVDILKPFFALHNRNMPPTRSDEVQFIISLVGIVVNVTALTPGRQFAIGTPQGQEIIKYFINYVSQLPDGNIQRLMLMAIFNISIHEHGTRLVMIRNDRRLFTLLKRLITERGAAMKCLSLKLLQAITYNTHDVTHLSILVEEIPIFRLTEMVQESSENERNLIKTIQQRYLKLRNESIARGSSIY